MKVVASENELDEYRALEQTIALVSRLKINLRGVSYRNVLQYLQTLKVLFFQCAQCGGMFAPDKPMKQCAILEIWFCKECYEKGAGL